MDDNILWSPRLRLRCTWSLVGSTAAAPPWPIVSHDRPRLTVRRPPYDLLLPPSKDTPTSHGMSVVWLLLVDGAVAASKATHLTIDLNIYFYRTKKRIVCRRHAKVFNTISRFKRVAGG